jgi:hypothetical protein
MRQSGKGQALSGNALRRRKMVSVHMSDEEFETFANRIIRDYWWWRIKSKWWLFALAGLIFYALAR